MEIERWSNQRSVRSLSDGDLGGRRASVDRTEAGWSRPGEPTPRWRSLLDRALLGGRTEASADVDRYGYAAPAPGRDDDSYGPPADHRDGWGDGRHASDGSYDVLAGEENPRFAQRLDPYTVRRVVELLCRTHDVVCVDTGNNVESANWQTVLQMADRLVVTTVPREDAAFTADWMLDLLVEAGMGRLVADAMTLLSCASPGPSPLIDDLAAHFRSRTREVVVVPYDPILETGSSIEYDMLAPATRRAWLNATATMLEPFAR